MTRENLMCRNCGCVYRTMHDDIKRIENITLALCPICNSDILELIYDEV